MTDSTRERRRRILNAAAKSLGGHTFLNGEESDAAMVECIISAAQSKVPRAATRERKLEDALREIKRLEEFPVNDWRVVGRKICHKEDDSAPLLRDHAASPQSLALIADALNWMVKRRKLFELVEVALAASVAEPDGAPFHKQSIEGGGVVYTNQKPIDEEDTMLLSDEFMLKVVAVDQGEFIPLPEGATAQCQRCGKFVTARHIIVSFNICCDCVKRARAVAEKAPAPRQVAVGIIRKFLDDEYLRIRKPREDATFSNAGATNAITKCLEELIVEVALAQAKEDVRPIVERELAAERPSSELLNMRLDAAEKAAPAAPPRCEYCNALWERNPATMMHRHPEGETFIYPCAFAAATPLNADELLTRACEAVSDALDSSQLKDLNGGQYATAFSHVAAPIACKAILALKGRFSLAAPQVARVIKAAQEVYGERDTIEGVEQAEGGIIEHKLWDELRDSLAALAPRETEGAK